MKKLIVVTFVLLCTLSAHAKTLADNNCNPLNIRYNKKNKWEGQEGSSKGFVEFKSVEYGARAAFKIIQKRDNQTLAEIINKHAPASENDTKRYIAFVEKQTGLKRTERINTDKERAEVLIAMAKMEGSKATRTQLINGFKLAHANI